MALTIKIIPTMAGFSLSNGYVIFYALRASSRMLQGRTWIQQTTKKNAENLKNSSLKGLVMQLTFAGQNMAITDICHGKRQLPGLSGGSAHRIMKQRLPETECDSLHTILVEPSEYSIM